MNKYQIIVDRIENGLAVCELDGEVVDIPLEKITGIVREGVILSENEVGDGYFVAKEETELRRKTMQDRFDRLKSEKK